MDDRREIKENIIKYIFRKITESPDVYFSLDEISSELGVDYEIVRDTLKSNETVKRIKIKYLKHHIKPLKKIQNFIGLLGGEIPGHWYITPTRFRIVVLDEWWFNR